jgi:hypothetical protein
LPLESQTNDTTIPILPNNNGKHGIYIEKQHLEKQYIQLLKYVDNLPPLNHVERFTTPSIVKIEENKTDLQLEVKPSPWLPRLCGTYAPQLQTNQTIKQGTYLAHCPGIIIRARELEKMKLNCPTAIPVISIWDNANNIKKKEDELILIAIPTEPAAIVNDGKEINQVNAELICVKTKYGIMKQQKNVYYQMHMSNYQH